MKLVKSIKELQLHLDQYRQNGDKLGLVPTMGALHEGHISLVEASKIDCDKTAVSIFVNPKQFNNANDLENYPNTLEKDIDMLIKAKCDILFIPNVNEMYPSEADVQFSFGQIEHNLEGKYRPGHFQGVGLIVTKLFNIFQPQSAFFGQKDLQQYYLIKKIIDELSFRIELKMVKTARESNGLAMSSRNLRLSENDRAYAGLLYNCLLNAKSNIELGKSIEQVKHEAFELFSLHPRFDLEYFDVVETRNFNSIDSIDDSNQIAVCISAYLGDVRLIDNLVLNS